MMWCNFLVPLFALIACTISQFAYNQIQGDCPGNDGPNFKSVTLSKCKEECDKTAACQSFLYDEFDVVKKYDTVCWTKTAVCTTPSDFLQDNIFSYNKLSGGHIYTKVQADCGGTPPIIPVSSLNESFNECKGKCDGQNGCQSFVYDRFRTTNIAPNGQVCWLKKNKICNSEKQVFLSYKKTSQTSSCNVFLSNQTCAASCRFLCPTSCTNSSIYGNVTYTADSEVCTSAVHNGLITASAGGVVQVRRMTTVQTSFPNVTRNNVASIGFNTWFPSFTFDCLLPPIPNVAYMTCSHGKTCDLVCKTGFSQTSSTNKAYQCLFGLYSGISGAECAKIPYPTALKTGRAGSSVNVQWTICSPTKYVTRQHIKVKLAGADMRNIDVDNNTASYNITGLQKGTTYTVIVSCNTSLASDGGSINTTVETCKDPSKVSSIKIFDGKLQINDRTKADINLTFSPITKLADMGCDNISAYTVFYRRHIIENTKQNTTCSLSGSCQITGLDSRKHYQVRLRVTNNAFLYNESAWMDVTASPNIPMPRDSITIKSRNASSVSISWTQCSPPADLVGHSIRIVQGSAVIRTENTTNPAITNKTIGSLMKGTMYNLTLTCIHYLWPSYGNYQRLIFTTANTCLEPKKVPDIQLRGQLDSADKTKTIVCVRFIPLTSEDDIGCTSVLQYNVMYLNNYGFTNKTLCNGLCTISDLIPYTNYSFSLTVCNNAFLSFNGSWNTTETPTGVPPKIKKTRVQPASYNSLRARWDPPDPPHGVIIAYEVTTFAILSGDEVDKHNTSNTETVISNLSTESNYSIQVRAYTFVGSGECSDKEIGRTEEELPSEPVNFISSRQSNTSITLSWFKPDSPNGIIQNYTVFCKLGKTNVSIIELQSDISKYEVKGLEQATKYICFVSARTKPGYGGRSNLTATTSYSPGPKNFLKIDEGGICEVNETAIVICKIPDIVEESLLPKEVKAFYEIIVVVKSSHKRKRRNTTPSACSEFVKNGNSCYVAAKFVPKEIAGKKFVVGDNKTYGEFRNKPLMKGKTYDVYITVLYTVGRHEARQYWRLTPESGIVAQKRIVSEEDNTSTVIGAVVGSVSAVLVIAAVIGAVIFLRRKKRSKSKTGRQSLASGLQKKCSRDKLEMTNLGSKGVTDVLDGKGDEAVYDNVKKGKRHTAETSTTLDNLATFVTEKRENQCTLLKEEYDNLPQEGLLSSDAARLPENSVKNRFKNILAYDSTRVVLDVLETDDDSTSDYINANYLKGYKDRPHTYIACQGPKPNTVNDTWRMIWKTKSPAIVMVTNVFENGKRKTEQYWPDSGSQKFADITVKFLSNETFNNYVIRTFVISKNKEERELTHFHFLGWPDHGVPKYPTALLNFRKKVRAYMAQQIDHPIIVHCSAGVGRTGTFIAIDYLIDQATAEGQINIFKYIFDMRHQRPKMIQTADQYYFLHDALLEALLLDDTTIPCSEFFKKIPMLKKMNYTTEKSKLMLQYEMLKLMMTEDNEEQYSGALHKDNMSKNRVRNIVPANRCRPYLSTEVAGGTDYINAVFVDGYRKKDCYIVTQMPLANTVVDFWRMIYDHQSNLIIMLNQVEAKDNTCAYLPIQAKKGEMYGPFKVTINVMIDRESFQMRDVIIENTKKPKERARNIKQFQFMNWKNNVSVPNQENRDLLMMIEELQNLKQLAGDGPITVHCLNGTKQSGLFIAICVMLEKIRLEQEVDVFQTVKIIRQNRPQFIENFEQYGFCYDIAGLYMDSFETYSNFK